MATANIASWPVTATGFCSSELASRGCWASCRGSQATAVLQLPLWFSAFGAPQSSHEWQELPEKVQGDMEQLGKTQCFPGHCSRLETNLFHVALWKTHAVMDRRCQESLSRSSGHMVCSPRTASSVPQTSYSPSGIATSPLGLPQGPEPHRAAQHCTTWIISPSGGKI